MQCCRCGREIELDVGRSPAYLTFGALQLQKARAVEGAALLPYLAIKSRVGNWHPAVEFDGRHPRLPRSELVAGQAELTFCSTQCLRDWLNGAVDLLESLRNEAEQGTATDVCRTNPLL